MIIPEIPQEPAYTLSYYDPALHHIQQYCPKNPSSSSSCDRPPTTGTPSNSALQPRFKRSRRKLHSPDEVNNKRLAVNSRQRTRMKIMNTAYERLMEALPALPEKRKPTKLETLQLAIQYLRHLGMILDHSRY